MENTYPKTKNGFPIIGRIGKTHHFKIKLEGEYYNMADTGNIVDKFTSNDAKAGLTTLTDSDIDKLSKVTAHISEELKRSNKQSQ